MKKYIIFAILLGVMASSAFSVAVDPNQDLAAGKTAYGTFSNPEVVTDGKVRGLSAQSGDIADTPQYLTVDLGSATYLDRVRIVWDKNALSNDFTVRLSADAKYWQEEARNLDASFGVVNNASGTVAISVSLKRAQISSRYLQIIVPAGTKVTNTKGSFVNIIEVEVFPSVNQKFSILSSVDTTTTNNSSIIKYTTSIGAAKGTINYGTDAAKMDKLASNSESGIENYIPISGLTPKTTYFYQIRTTDFYGDEITSKVYSFVTNSDNVALNKKVSGTFFYVPDDKYVQNGTNEQILSRVTDGGTSYFTSMATSGNINTEDQYVVIDLGNVYTLKSIVSYWRRLAYPESLIVQLSSNNTDWTTVADGVDVSTGSFARSDAGDPIEVLGVGGGIGRYVKLLVKKGSPFYHKHANWNFVQLMEVKAFAQ